MSNQHALKISPEQAKEMPMVDLAFMILKQANTPFYYRDLMQEIAKIKGLSNEEVMDVIAQVYTEINIDGRFACVGTNLWGLKRWYPVEKADDAMGNAKYPRIINDDDDDLDDEDLFGEEEDTYDVENDVDFDSLDVENDDVFMDDPEEDLDEDVDEVDDVDDEVLDEEEEDLDADLDDLDEDDEDDK